ncbi:hypothetical protein K439DRAFT_1641516 [Ramaria rubella]|nr:hypothetical protein K439DRAFT_1641516 [Ramaria rubella]
MCCVHSVYDRPIIGPSIGACRELQFLLTADVFQVVSFRRNCHGDGWFVSATPLFFTFSSDTPADVNIRLTTSLVMVCFFLKPKSPKDHILAKLARVDWL